MKKLSRGKKIWFLLCAGMLLAALGCAVGLRFLSGRLLSQREAERWRGENEQDYKQISCFMPVGSAVGLKEIYAFRYALLDDLQAVGIEWEEDVYPFIDAWSSEGKMKISGDKAATDAPVLAVGGQFFEFHPLRLLSGSYLSEGELSPDRVVLDRELAWELFGGTDHREKLRSGRRGRRRTAWRRGRGNSPWRRSPGLRPSRGASCRWS